MMSARRRARSFPRLGIASLIASMGETGIIYQERGIVGIVWWEGNMRRTTVLSTVN